MDSFAMMLVRRLWRDALSAATGCIALWCLPGLFKLPGVVLVAMAVFHAFCAGYLAHRDDLASAEDTAP